MMIFLGSAVSGCVSHIDSALAQLDSSQDKDAIMKLTFIKFILDSDLFGRKKRHSEHSKMKYCHKTCAKIVPTGCETDLMTWYTMKSQFEDSLTILDSIESTNPVVISLVAELKTFFTVKINFIDLAIRYCTNIIVIIH